MNATSPADGSKSSRPAGRKVCPRDPPCWAASPTSVLPCGRLPGSPELEGGGRAPSALSLADGAMKPFRKIAPEYFRRCSTARLASPAALVLPAAEGQSAAPGPPRRPAPGGGTRFGAWNHPDFRGALRCARRAPPGGASARRPPPGTAMPAEPTPNPLGPPQPLLLGLVPGRDKKGPGPGPFARDVFLQRAIGACPGRRACPSPLHHFFYRFRTDRRDLQTPYPATPAHDKAPARRMSCMEKTRCSDPASICDLRKRHASTLPSA